VRWEVKNASASAPLHLKAMVAADFYFDGSDRGTGIFTEGPPRFIGGTNADTGNSGGFIKVLSTSPPWSHYQALEFGGAAHQVWGKIAASASSTDPSFDDTVIGDQVDNAGAVPAVRGQDAPLRDHGRKPGHRLGHARPRRQSGDHRPRRGRG
jgi:hypothetical protein